jgi:hypothetical protein
MHDLFTKIDLKKLRSGTKDGDNPGKLYLSPEAYKCAILGMKAGSGYNLIKSDVFSFGLILLESGIQMSIQDVYNPDGSFNSDALDHYIHVFKCRYPENNLITSSVTKMLEVKETHRPDFKELFEKAPTYEMVKKYFQENPELAQKDVISMRTSMHGSANVMIEPKDFAKLSPAPSNYQNYSESKQSRRGIPVEANDSVQCEADQQPTSVQRKLNYPETVRRESNKPSKSKKPPTPGKKRHPSIKRDLVFEEDKLKT